MKQINEIKLNIGYKVSDIVAKICHDYKCKSSDIKSVHLLKEAIDARKDVRYVVNVGVEFNTLNALTEKLKDTTLDTSGFEVSTLTTTHRPLIVGFGPSGMFCALALAKMGLRPIVIEQGKCVEEREKDIERFWRDGTLNENSNVHYGEGGAGTFSDGKLNSNISNSYTKKIINEFILHGAPKEIYYKSKPHIGTDNLKKIVRSIREEIIGLGGEVRFETKLTDYTKTDIFEVVTINLKTQKQEVILADRLILAIGHSPLNTFRMLKNKGVTMTQKPFAMGVRIEHPQENINLSQYGVIDDRLPSADYKLVEHLENGRSVFTFCMCPGGYVVASSSEKDTVVTNGMSNFARNSKHANSALLVDVRPSDYDKGDVLDGFEFQRKYERKAFELGGGGYVAPAISVSEFLGGKSDINASSYEPNIKITDISKCLPDFVTDSLKLALSRFNKKLINFTKNAMLIALESRSSSPVTVNRNSEFMSVNTDHLYPIGEGAGYAGGIITSAMDGYKCALKIKEEILNAKN